MRRLPSLALAATVLAALASSASAQNQKLPASGVYNCPVSVMHRCKDDKCETRKPSRPMEIGINFDTKEACMRRGSGECRQVRSFEVVERGPIYNLVFAKHSMIFQLRPGGDLVGGDIGSGGVVTVIARCARG